MSVSDSGGAPHGTVSYSWRQSMIVGAAGKRTVVVTVTSTTVDDLVVNPASGDSPAVVIAGIASVQYRDARRGTDYTNLDVSGATFEVDAVAGSANPAFAIAVLAPNGTLLHTSANPYDRVTGAATSQALASGSLSAQP